MRVGFSFWGLLANFDGQRFIDTDTPDGHRHGRFIFVDALCRAGHQVFALQERREPQKYKNVTYVCEDDDNCFPDLDVIFVEFRWSTYKNDRTHPDHDPSRYEPDLDRQREIIEHYHGDIPIIVWDTDLKITLEDEKRWPKLIITDPTLQTNRLTRSRASLPFWTDWKELLPTVEPYPIYGYIGNNYERPDEFEKFYFGIKQNTRIMGVQTSMYGNWLQVSPERKHPASLISTHREVAFNHRMNFYDSMKIMNRFMCTTHVSKPRYYETGFLSPRYLEALAVNCPAIVPEAMDRTVRKLRGESALGRQWVAETSTDVLDILQRVKRMSLDERHEAIQEQRESLKELDVFSVENVVDFIEGCV